MPRGVLTRGVDRILLSRSPSAVLRRAEALAKSGRHALAFQHYVRAAHCGLAEADFRVGRCYLEGAGVPRSGREAVRWLEHAAERGHVKAQCLLAILYLSGLAAQPKSGDDSSLFIAEKQDIPDFAAAMNWARRAAESGSSEGQAILGHLLISGPEEMRDPEESEAWYRRSAASLCPNGMLGYALALIRKHGFHTAQEEIVINIRKAADAGLPTALYLLAQIHEAGLGVAQDSATAAALYKRAAEVGHSAAQVRFGLALQRGIGIAADPSQGESWLRRAALNGEREAAFLVGEICAKGGSLPPNYAEAASWFLRAAMAGQKDAARALGQLYLTGKGVAPDTAEAARWFRLSAEAGDEVARTELGNLALKGLGETCDGLHAAQWFADAAQSGDPIASFNYAVCLAQGIGVPRNDAEAAHWLRKAAGEVASAQYWYGRFLVEGRGVAKNLREGRAWIARAAGAGFRQSQTPNLQAPDAMGDAAHPSDAVDTSKPQKTVFQLNGTESAMLSHNATWGAWQAVATMARRSPDRPDLCSCGSGLRSCRCCDLDRDYVCPPEVRETMERLATTAANALAKGESTEADRLCRDALESAPRLSSALWTLAQIRRREGRVKAAKALLERLVSIQPNNIVATLELAALLFDAGDLVAAEGQARNAIRLAPEYPQSHNLMGMILTEAQRPHIGEFHYRRALELSATRDPVLLANLAWNLKGQGRLAEARGLYRESFEAAPNVFQTLLGWSKLEEADRDLSAAGLLLDKAAEIRPDDPALRTTRAALFAREKNFDAALSELDRPRGSGVDDASGSIAADPGILAEKGRILDALGHYDEAFRCFAESKRQTREISGKCYLDREAEDLVRRLRQFFVAERLRLMPVAPQREDCAQPIFVLGFPRSGTTLTEQALSHHPRISAGDELPFVNELCDALPRLFCSPLIYPEALAELWMGDNRRGLEILRDIYLQKAEMRHIMDPTKPWFTDKMPLNEMHLGLIALVFPNAPLIHLLRHPLDVVLSAFSHQMTHGYLCAYALETIARHYVLIMDLVQHYRAELSLRYLPIRYEDMVADLRGSLRLMLDFVGEPWDERCVNFEENRRLPQTPSYAQVAQKLYDRSRYRYRHYLKHLESVIPILQPVMDRLGYSVGAAV